MAMRTITFDDDKFQLVPKHITDGMEQAAYTALGSPTEGWYGLKEAWVAALSAAPCVRRCAGEKETHKFGIVTPMGNPWSHITFDNEAEAEKHLRDHELNKHCDLTKYRVVRVSFAFET